MWPLSPALPRCPTEETLLRALRSPRSCTAAASFCIFTCRLTSFLLLPHVEQTGQKVVWEGRGGLGVSP